MRKFASRLLLGASIFGLSLFIAEIMTFAVALLGSPPLQNADVIIAFEGEQGRARAAYALAESGYAPAVIVSPANPQRLRNYQEWFKPAGRIEKIVEEKARTTFENALYSARILKRKHFDSAILVTSWDHMPRSHILLKMMLTGAPTRVHPYPVPTGKLNRENWYRHAAGWKMVFNEMLKFWGSLVEVLYLAIRGELPDQVPGDANIVRQLKQILLFQIH